MIFFQVNYHNQNEIKMKSIKKQLKWNQLEFNQ